MSNNLLRNEGLIRGDVGVGLFQTQSYSLKYQRRTGAQETCERDVTSWLPTLRTEG